MNRDEYIRKSTAYLGRLAHEIKAENASGLFDINAIAEDFFVPILAVLYNCKDLKNENRLRMNFPAVDLGCRSTRMSFQVTSETSSAKIAQTLEKFLEHKLEEHFGSVYVLVITEKQQNYSSEKLKSQIAKLPFEFRVEEHIIDYQTLAHKFNEIDTKDLALIHGILEREFSKKDQHLLFRCDLEKFLEFGRSKIEVEKETKKYISAVFVETSSAKESMRFFANPMFFCRKIDDLIGRIDFSYLNKLLSMAGEDPLKPDLDGINQSLAPHSLDELCRELKNKKLALNNAKKLLGPLSWHREEGVEKYTPNPINDSAWGLFRHPIEATATYGVEYTIERTIEAIDLTQSKIFLVTGMAGQGKTNFVCDLVENQFRVFEIPSIFIPARDLNGYPAPHRIVDFIGNNRFAPKVSGLHELLALFDSIAKENQKPFVIVIDGINEVRSLDEFSDELKTFLNAVCQYEFVKVVLTCRSEFFDQRFASVLKEPLAKHLYRIQDLRSEMSDENKERLIRAYFRHFSISLGLSQSAERFLRDDLLLLRIFCENNAGAHGKFVSAIYKGDLFEQYLLRKVQEFSIECQKAILPTLYKIVRLMLAQGNYTNQSTRDFDAVEMGIVEKLISEDIVLRREVPDAGLLSLGIENISFTYDEMRDFIIAHFVVHELSVKNPTEVKSLFARLPGLPIYEGVFRYIYVLARKDTISSLVDLCEADPHFLSHYVKNLALLPPDVQTNDDENLVRSLLASSDDDYTLREISWFLFRCRNLEEPLNIRILIEHTNSLDDQGCRRLFAAMFSRNAGYWTDRWRDGICEFLKSIPNQKDEDVIELEPDALAFVLELAGFADWEVREGIAGKISKLLQNESVNAAVLLARNAQSGIIRRYIGEIVTTTGGR